MVVLPGPVQQFMVLSNRSHFGRGRSGADGSDNIPGMIVQNDPINSSGGPGGEQLDLALAAELQAALLPTPELTGLDGLRGAALNRMCGTVGGDFYDVLRLNDDQVALVVGDVVGHGVRAALVMAQIMGFLRPEAPRTSRPVECITALNRRLIELGDRTGTAMCCSIFYAVLDAPSGGLFFVNAGHPRPLLCRPEAGAGPRAFGPRALLLGVQQKLELAEACHTFAPGERLVLYTDGLLDATSPEGEPFDRERLRQVVARNTGQPPHRCAADVFACVESFRHNGRQRDDETILVVDRMS